MAEPAGEDVQRLRVAIRGAVQGVGFRPFLYRLAADLGLTGWVLNSTGGVVAEVEGRRDRLDEFLLRIEPEKPAPAFVQGLEPAFLDPVGFKGFEIRESTGGRVTTFIQPDIATCPACLSEIFDPSDRRFTYPFTNCTHCGPRYTILEALPYDRPHTTMRRFTMCTACRAEYEDPNDRRFHAQPNACSACGPHLELWDPEGVARTTHHEALLETAGALRDGAIVAVKGLGGYHLMVDARSEAVVRRLRERKLRDEKPFALMFPSIKAVQEVCRVSRLEERLLTAPEAPIVLLERRAPGNPAVAPGNPNLGVMLPYTPLHHLLMRELGFEVVATSGNRADEPICTSEDEAIDRLAGIADLFLVHDRPIARPVDDSIVRVVMGRELMLRRARGYAPLPVHLPSAARSAALESAAPAVTSQPGLLPFSDRPRSILAVGAHLKNTVALAVGGQAFISQHLGDLENEAAFNSFRNAISTLEQLYELAPAVVVHDMHPDYVSTRWANDHFEGGPSLLAVQHHYAHVLSCLTENQLDAPVLGVCWDGTGYGTDGTIWGGEFLRITDTGFERVAHLHPFRLPGGDRAVKEPRRAALGLLFELFGDDLFEQPDLDEFTIQERRVLIQMLRRGLNSPVTSSAGRLFDGVASLIGLCQRSAFEAQVAMMLEFAVDDVPADVLQAGRLPPEEAAAAPPRDGPGAPAGSEIGDTNGRYPFCLVPATAGDGPTTVDWRPMVVQVIEDRREGVPAGRIATQFHDTLAAMIGAVAREAAEPRVVLTGGCFQNKHLTEKTVHLLREEGFHPYWHQRVPPNDGGISLGQIAAALHPRS